MTVRTPFQLCLCCCSSNGLVDMDIVSESDFDDSAPPPIPHGWEEAFNNVDESSDASIQIFNAHITHLRWTYRCLLAHYNHCLVPGNRRR